MMMEGSNLQLDSYVTHHIIEDRSMFITIQHQKCSVVTYVGGHEHDILSIGSVSVHVQNGYVQIISQVIDSFIILSLGLIFDKNYNVEFL